MGTCASKKVQKQEEVINKEMVNDVPITNLQLEAIVDDIIQKYGRKQKELHLDGFKNFIKKEIDINKTFHVEELI